MKNPTIRRLRKQFILVMMGICLGFLLTIFGVQYFSSRRSMREESTAALRMALEMDPGSERMNAPQDPDRKFREEPADDFDRDQDADYDNSDEDSEKDDSDEDSEKDRETDSDDQEVDSESDREEAWAGDFNGRGRRGTEGLITDFREGDRTAVLVANIAADGTASVERNNLFFVGTTDVQTLTDAALAQGKENGTLTEYSMRFMVRETAAGKRIAFVDTSSELAKLKKDVRRSLLIGGGVLLIMFLLSLFLSRLMIRPVEKAWDAQKQFVADASHELKTPLTVILSNAEMIRKSKDGQTPKNARRLENLETEAVRMKELVRDLLEIARGDISGREIPKDVLNISELCEEIALTWEPVIFEAGRTLETSIAPDIQMEGNPDGLRRLTEILLDNALKYSNERGRITLRLSRVISAEKGGSRKRLIHLSVEDQGEPMSPEVLEKIFDRFYRADASREETPGYGLGLSIADTIVKQHGGSIKATATDSTNIFTVKLPEKAG